MKKTVLECPYCKSDITEDIVSIVFFASFNSKFKAMLSAWFWTVAI